MCICTYVSSHTHVHVYIHNLCYKNTIKIIWLQKQVSFKLCSFLNKYK